MVIGIDLGTSNSVVAYMSADGPQIIPNSLEQRLTPSVVGVDLNGEILVGEAAKELFVTQPERCASLFKRYMGEKRQIRIADKTFSPEELSSLVLKSLKDDAEAFLKTEIESAVITVPAYFNENQRQATIEAGRLAGLKVARIINEPTAASIAYGLQEPDEDKMILVFDLGGGTFDVSVVDIFDGTIQVQSSSGEAFLGGEDFTVAIASVVLKEIGLSLERTEMYEQERFTRLLRECEKIKKKLSIEESAILTIPDESASLNENCVKVEISRTDFQEWTKHILENIENPVRRCLGDSDIDKSEIDEVILVGGATRMATIHDKVKSLFGQEPLNKIDPDLVVALGAAVQAGLIDNNEELKDLVITDVAPFTLGVETTKAFGDNYKPGYFLPVINRNTTIPASRVERVATLSPNQTEVKVRIFQGESRKVKDNLALGSFNVKGIPPGPAGQEIDIRLTYDLNGILEVEATIVKTGKKANLVIKGKSCNLSEQDLSEALLKMKGLKKHPREDSKNRHVLRRAERLFKELDNNSKANLEYLLDAFEAALETQDKDLSEKVRVELVNFLNNMEDDSGENSTR